MNNPQQAIVDVESVELPVKYTLTNAKLEELKEQYSAVPDCSTRKGYKEAVASLAVWRPLRGKLEIERKKHNEDAQVHIKKVNAEAKRILGFIETYEKPIKAAKDVEDQKIKDAEKVEAERIQNIKNHIDDIKRLPMDAAFNVVTIEKALENLRNIDMKPFQEFENEASKVCIEIYRELQTMLKHIQEKEAESKKLAEEKEKLEADQKKMNEDKAAQEEKLRKDREEVEAEKRKVEEEKQKLEEEKAKLKADAEKVERDKVEAEKRKADEAERIEKEKAYKIREEELEKKCLEKRQVDIKESRKLALDAMYVIDGNGDFEDILQAIEEDKIPGVMALWTEI